MCHHESSKIAQSSHADGSQELYSYVPELLPFRAVRSRAGWCPGGHRIAIRSRPQRGQTVTGQKPEIGANVSCITLILEENICIN